MMVNSINFALMAEEEQNAIIGQFQNFLNSLDFPLQIIIQSRRLNITSYLDKLKDLENRQSNDLLRTQVIEYRNFINEIVSGGSIMNKSFYVVVPFQTMILPGTNTGKGKTKNPDSQNSGTGPGTIHSKQVAAFTKNGIRSFGFAAVRPAMHPAKQLGTGGVFWSSHHLEESERGYYPEIPPELIQ